MTITNKQLTDPEIHKGIEEISNGLKSNNPTMANDGIVKVSKALGIKPLFENFDDFNKFMSDPNRTLTL